MAAAIDHLKKIINPDVNIQVTVNNTNADVVIEESDSQAELKKVTIKGFAANQTIAFKLDVQGKRISEYLNPSEHNINKACDGIIFSLLDGIPYVFICELKSSKPKESDVLLKYRNTGLFIHFIFSILKEFYEAEDSFKIKYLLFDTKRKFNKTPTKQRKISSEKYGENKELEVYRIHHLGETEFLNIRHLNL